MTIGIVATLNVKEGKNEEFEASFKELMAIVADKEPGNNFYILHRSRKDGNTYAVLESYADQAALDAHGKSDEFKAVSAGLGDCLAGRPVVEIYDAV